MKLLKLYIYIFHKICTPLAWKFHGIIKWGFDWRHLRTSHIKQQRRQWHPTPVLLPGKSHGRRSLVGCSPWGRWGSDTTEWLHFHFSLSCIGEGNGSPLQCSCLENPRNGEPGGLPSMGSHRVGHNWSGLAAAYKANTPLWINWRHWELKWLLVTEQLNTGGTVLEHRPLPSNSNTLSQIIGSHVIQKMAHKYEKMRRLSGVKDS